MRKEITLPLGYSPTYTPESEYREFFEYLFGPYTELQFRVEEVSDHVHRVRVEGVNLRRPHRPYIEEQFTGSDKFAHRTKNGRSIEWAQMFSWPQGEIRLSIADDVSETLPVEALAAAE